MTAVQEALERALTPAGDLAAIEYEAEELAVRSQYLLPIEKEAQEAITKRMLDLKLVAERVNFAAQTGLQMIPLEVLSWARSHVMTGRILKTNFLLPRLALINVSAEPTFVLRADDYRGYLETGVPTHALPQYQKVFASMRKASATEKKSLRAEFAYTGVIPHTSRDKIVETQLGGLFSGGGIFLLCEAQDWKISTQKIQPPPRVWDPLVVGYKHKGLWLIDVFDPTPIEKYLALEFAATPALPTQT